MFSRSVSAISAKNANSRRPRAAGVVHPGQAPGEHLQGQAVGGQMVGERGGGTAGIRQKQTKG
jgi:hypothetical protein